MTARRARAFTLIELLIVAAILAVLAAIAIPNYLEAQIRAKVSRTHSDLRRLSVAIESYRIDQELFPRVPSLLHPLSQRMIALTTPVSYITSAPVDPFFELRPNDALEGREPYYVYASGNLYAGAAGQYDTKEYLGLLYSLAGRGPDRDIVFGGYCLTHPAAIRSLAPIRGAYDPTNGTISAGDILRFGSGRLDDRH